MALIEKLTAVGDAIRAKTGTAEKIPLSKMPEMISAISGGGAEQYINFYGKGGELLHQYALSDFEKMSVLPMPPTKLDNCTFQGWNYSLDTIKSMKSHVNVAAIYRQNDTENIPQETSEPSCVDGTKLYLHIDNSIKITLYFRQSAASGVTVNWGDSTSSEPSTAVNGRIILEHQYEPGDYIITFDIADGCKLSLGDNNTSYCVMGYIKFNSTWIPQSHTLVKAEIDLRNTIPLYGAFRYCIGLKEVIFGSGESYALQNYIFDGCYALENVTLSESVTSIGEYAFRQCYRLRNIDLPCSVKEIKSNAFCECRRLHDIRIPSSVTTIYGSAFIRCTALRSVTMENGIKSIYSSAFQECLYLSEINLPNSITSIGSSAFYKCYSLKLVVLPANLQSITSSCFSLCLGLRSVIISEGVKTIGSSAFNGCASLNFVAFPKSVTKIDASAFSGCVSLRNVVFGENLSSVGESAFADCYPLEYVILPQSVTQVGLYAFKNCSNLKNLVLSESAKLSTGSFVGCNIQSESMRNLCHNMLSGCTEVRKSAFETCGYLETAVVSNSIQAIGDNAFKDAYCLESVTLPETLATIGSLAFQHDYKLSDVEIPTTVTSIGANAFEQCHGIESFTLPSSVRSVGANMCNSSYGLEQVEIDSSGLTLSGGAFCNCYRLTKLKFAAGFKGVFTGSSAFAGSGFEEITDLPPNTVFNESSCFSACYGLEKADIHAVSNNGSGSFNYTFNSCYALSDVEMSKIATSVGYSMFQSCYALACDIHINENVDLIDSNAFNDCRNLKNVIFDGAKLLNIYSNVFTNCYSLKEIRIPHSVTNMASCFANCYALSRIYMYPKNAPTGTSNIGTLADGYIIYVPKGCISSYETQWTAHKGHFAEFEYLTADKKEMQYTVPLHTNTVAVKNSFAYTDFPDGQTFSILPTYSGKNISSFSDVSVDVSTGVVQFSVERASNLEYDKYEPIQFRVWADDTDIGCEFSLSIRFTSTELVSEYTVQTAGGYPFELVDDDYYCSTNQGKANSFSICRLEFISYTGKIFIDCIGEGESNYDFGIVSDIDKTLTATNSADTGSNVKKSFKGLGKYNLTLEYDVEDTEQHFIYLKYRKDGSTNVGKDCMQFRVRFE